LILGALAKLNDAKSYYKDLTSLAKYVAKEISLVETKESQCRPICYTTLLRKNCAYRVIILEYFIKNKKRFSKANLEKVDFYSFSKDIIESNPSLQAFILNFQMEIQELKSELSFQKDENVRLKAHLQRQSNNFNKLPNLTQLESFPKPNDFDKIVTAFRTLVEYIPYIHMLSRFTELKGVNTRQLL
jgi:hypothetical protein